MTQLKPNNNAPIGAVAIGRNEGERLVSCLESLKDQVDRIVYVDSGSTDGSVEAARSRGVEVVLLDMDIPFTAARARNEGAQRLNIVLPEHEYVQFLDGDCDLVEGWIETARKVLDHNPDTAVVCGRRREKAPEASIWNRMIDSEWDTPIGEAKSCGGDALVRRSAFEQVEGYRPRLIAGEEPEMCYRLRHYGWRIHRIDAEMTAHDAAMFRFSQWWKRSKRAGHAFAEVSSIHAEGTEGFWKRETHSALFWGLFLPLFAIVGGVAHPALSLVILVWVLQIFRVSKGGLPLLQSLFVVLGKVPEALGVLQFWRNRLMGRTNQLIEYK